MANDKFNTDWEFGWFSPLLGKSDEITINDILSILDLLVSKKDLIHAPIKFKTLQENSYEVSD